MTFSPRPGEDPVAAVAIHGSPAFRKARPWRSLEGKEKIRLAVSACLDLKAHIPLAVSLRLGPRVAERVGDIDWLRRQLIYHLKQALGRLPTVIFVWGVTGSRLHVHAAILARSTQDLRRRIYADTSWRFPWGSGECERIERALLAAAGEWGSRQHQDRQLQIKPIYSAGWGDYMALHLRSSRNAPNGGKSMTNSMRDLAKNALTKK